MYILTKEEESEAIKGAVNSLKEYFKWRHLDMGEPLHRIEEKLKDTDWEAQVDKDEILQRANSNKQYNIWQNQNRVKEREAESARISELNARYTARFVFGLMQFVSKNDYGKELIVNSDTKHLITVICYFISKDERFETELGFSFKKGLLLRGAAGLGKTYLVKCIKDNEISPINIYSMIEIAERIKADGEYGIPFSNGISYLDDVGTEEATVNHYGTKINFFKNFIEMYYLNNRPFNRLMISTNNSFSEIEDKYGFRVRSRIKDMFNIIDVTGKDLRG